MTGGPVESTVDRMIRGVHRIRVGASMHRVFLHFTVACTAHAIESRMLEPDGFGG